MVSKSATAIWILFYIFLKEASAEDPKYKPVVIVHGIWDKKSSLDFMADRIRQVC